MGGNATADNRYKIDQPLKIERNSVDCCRTTLALSHSLAKQPHQRDQDDYDRQYEPFPFHGYSSPWLTNRQRHLHLRAAPQRRSFQSAASLNCSVLVTLELRLVIENHIQQ